MTLLMVPKGVKASTGAGDGNAGQTEIQGSLSAGLWFVWGVVMFLFAVFLAIAIVGAFLVVLSVAMKAGSIDDIGRAVSALASLRHHSHHRGTRARHHHGPAHEGS